MGTNYYLREITFREKEIAALKAAHKADLEAACALVRAAGLTTGHAGNCAELVNEVLRDVDELKKSHTSLGHWEWVPGGEDCVEEVIP